MTIAPVPAAFCPMHLHLDAGARILTCGPTFVKICGDAEPLGQSLFDVLTLVRPQGLTSVNAMLARPAQCLHLTLCARPTTRFKAQAVPDADGGIYLNLSFSGDIVGAVQAHGLTAHDFAPTDPTIDLLYLFEAKSAAMDSSRALNRKLQVARVAAEEQAFTDTLTGLKNRRGLDHVLNRWLGEGVGFALVHLDLDHFKPVNDTLGHAAGDAVLQEVARRLSLTVRREDVVARTGGDEFILLLRNQLCRDDLLTLGERLIEELEKPIWWDGAQRKISASLGIACAMPIAGGSPLLPATLIERADAALYQAKNAGRAQACIFDRDTPLPG